MRKLIPFIILGILFVIVGVTIWPSVGEILPTATRVIFHPGVTLKEVNDKTNILLLGIGGGSHDGPNLTDTILLASIDWKKNIVTLVSIPRDLWVPDISNIVKKANEAYAEGGMTEAKTIMQEVTGQQIQYGIRLDFQGFVDAIDQIGGVDITVERALDDYNYPISGKEDDTCNHTSQETQTFTATASADTDTFAFFPCRFKHLHFDPGRQHMDGTTALEFARSRHGVGIEGSDFARSTRQQLIIEAVRNKMISTSIFNPGRILGLYGIVKRSIDTDITDSELGLFLDRLPSLRVAKIVTANIDTGNYTTGRLGLLENSPITSTYDFSAALIPRVGNGNFSELHSYITCEITKGNCTVQPVAAPSQ